MNATPPTELYSKTQRTNEAATSGINIGPGANANALMMSKSTVKTSDTLASMIPFDNTGEIAILYQEFLARGD
jgi:hypothetical protein